MCREEREKIIDALETNSDKENKNESGDDGITDEDEEENKYQWNTLTQDPSGEEDGKKNLFLSFFFVLKNNSLLLQPL